MKPLCNTGFVVSSCRFFSLSSSTNTSIQSSKWNYLFMFTDIVEVGDSFHEVHSINCLSYFTGIFEVHTKVRAACFGGLCWVDRRCRVTDHGGQKFGKRRDLVVMWWILTFGDVTVKITLPSIHYCQAESPDTTPLNIKNLSPA